MLAAVHNPPNATSSATSPSHKHPNKPHEYALSSQPPSSYAPRPNVKKRGAPIAPRSTAMSCGSRLALTLPPASRATARNALPGCSRAVHAGRLQGAAQQTAPCQHIQIHSRAAPVLPYSTVG